MIWKAASDKVIVRYIKPSDVSEGGIILPQRVKAKVSDGIVLAAGPDAKNVEPGDAATFLFEGAVEIEDGIYSLSVDYIMGIQRETE